MLIVSMPELLLPGLGIAGKVVNSATHGIQGGHLGWWDCSTTSPARMDDDGQEKKHTVAISSTPPRPQASDFKS